VSSLTSEEATPEATMNTKGIVKRLNGDFRPNRNDNTHAGRPLSSDEIKIRKAKNYEANKENRSNWVRESG
jgi:hypothetical protein